MDQEPQGEAVPVWIPLTLVLAAIGAIVIELVK